MRIIVHFMGPEFWLLWFGAGLLAALKLNSMGWL